MKGVAFLLVIILLGAGAYYFIVLPNQSTNADLEMKVFEDLRAKGLEKIYVAINDTSMLIRFETPAINGNLMNFMYDVALDAYKIVPKDNVRVESYFSGEPILALSVKGKDLTSKNIDGLHFEDIRRPEFKVETDLGVFDVLIYNVSLSREKATITLEYLADQEGFWRDYLAMNLVVLEDVPWVDEIEFNYLGEGNRTLTLTSKSNDILAVYSGEMTPEEFSKRIQVSQSENTK
jgi:hypothetical protein